MTFAAAAAAVAGILAAATVASTATATTTAVSPMFGGNVDYPWLPYCCVFTKLLTSNGCCLAACFAIAT
jgi:hypothetical protein